MQSSLRPHWRQNSKAPKRLRPSVQATLFETLADLLNNGFSLQAAMRFIVDINGARYRPLKATIAQLAAGQGLATALRPYVAVDLYYQLLIAEIHGQLATTLRQSGQLMRTRAEQARQVRRLLQYPALLLLMVFATLAMVQFAILPNFSAGSGGPSRLVSGLVVVVVGLGIVSGLVYWYLKRLPTRERYQRLARLPLVGPVITTYTGYYLTLNAGMLLSGGLGIRAICEVSRQFDERALLAQQGRAIERALLAGQTLVTTIKADCLLPNELALLVSKASPAERMSRELLYFASLQYNQLIRKLNRGISWIQPIFFLIVAAVILGTYLSVLLPLYQSMGDVLK